MRTLPEPLFGGNTKNLRGVRGSAAKFSTSVCCVPRGQKRFSSCRIARSVWVTLRCDTSLSVMSINAVPSAGMSCAMPATSATNSRLG